MDNATPAECMDAISDRLGSLIPGGYRLPPRHPAKVCLVMGLLGLIAAGMETALNLMFPPKTMYPIRLYRGFESASIVFGVVIVLPFALWMGKGWLRSILSACLSAVAFGAVVFALASSHNSGEYLRSFVRLFQNVHIPTFLKIYLVLLVPGVLIAVFAIGRMNRWKSILSMFVCGVAFSNWLNFREEFLGDNSHHIALQLGQLGNLMIINFNFVDHALLLGSLAFSLGIALWDMTPSPKFEPIKINSSTKS